MSSSADRELLDALTRDLPPVRPAPPFGLSVAAVLSVGGLCLLSVFARDAPLAGFEQLASEPVFGVVFAGLVAAGVGGTLAGLSGAAPDRAASARVGVAASFIALVTALLSCAAALAGSSIPTTLGLAAHSSCFGHSALIALAPGAVLVFFALRGWVGEPRLAALAGLVGALSLGSLVVHLGCAALEPVHLVLGHLAAPLLISALALAPLAGLLKRYAR